ncbi:MAG: hypothetical protein A2579_05885 [Lysobacterales bacterium RIFOXYD1_FULL_69_11]|nr:MAG: hypothetical protein A2190_03105 [Xanthomonadales bacterium RIFOXYA1_FULL_69_10]OHE86724.1 MAG: hypothetical protein A2579_05885 [Xanthomonadales bacterium RIFOXYD1_FULL_69_11]
MDPHLFEAVPDALVIVDPDGRIVRANAKAHAMFGSAPDTLEGQGVESLLPADLRHRHRGHRARYLQDPHVRPMGTSDQVLVGQRGDGTCFPVEIALSPLVHGGTPHVLASIRDITDTQRQRQALARAHYDAIAAQVGQLAIELTGPSLFDALASLLANALGAKGVAIALRPPGSEHVRIQAVAGHGWRIGGGEARGLVLPGSASASTPVVYAPGDCPSTLLVDTDPGWPGDACVVMVPLQATERVAGALLVAASADRVDADALHLLHSTGSLLSTLLRQRRAEEALGHAQRLDALGQLTGGIAHDFNNLLTVLSGSLQLLRPQVHTEDAADLIESAMRSVDRGSQLTRKLLAFARRQRLLPRAVDVGELLDDLQRMLARTLGERIVLQVSSPDGVPPLFVDPGQVEAALLNLVFNARDAMAMGGTIEIAASALDVPREHADGDLSPGRYVRITVADTGVGMPPATLARAMEPFFTTKDAGRGSGLGLSMVYGFARQSGGGLRIDSTPGRGTRVSLYLPVARDEVELPARPATPIAATRGERVLVVEDDADVRRIAIAFLRSGGYDVRAVPDGETALAMLQAERFDLLFSDVMLGPGMDGQAMALAARATHPRIAVLLATGYEAPLGEAPGPFELISKPYERDDLLARVRGLLDAIPPPCRSL